MIQFLVFTGIIAIIQIEAITTQAVRIQNGDFKLLHIITFNSDNRVNLVNTDDLNIMDSAPPWMMSAES